MEFSLPQSAICLVRQVSSHICGCVSVGLSLLLASSTFSILYVNNRYGKNTKSLIPGSACYAKLPELDKVELSRDSFGDVLNWLKKMKKKGKIFISYRRSDSEDATSLIEDRLTHRFGREQVFRDAHSIPLGEDFPKFILDEVSRCDVFIVVIGKSWLDILEDNQAVRRLDNPKDWVRVEIETALKFEKQVIPVLVGGASLPQKNRLAPSLQPLVDRNKADVRSAPDFKNDINRLIEAIEEYFVKNNLALIDDPKVVGTQKIEGLQAFANYFRPKRKNLGLPRFVGTTLLCIIAFYFLLASKDLQVPGFLLFAFLAYKVAYL